MQVVCGFFRKITTALLNSNDICNGDIQSVHSQFLGKSCKIESQIISWHTSGRRLLYFYHPVTIYQLLRIKCVTVVESTIFIMSLDLDAAVGHVLKQLQVGCSQDYVTYFELGTKIVG